MELSKIKEMVCAPDAYEKYLKPLICFLLGVSVAGLIFAISGNSKAAPVPAGNTTQLFQLPAQQQTVAPKVKFEDVKMGKIVEIDGVRDNNVSYVINKVEIGGRIFLIPQNLHLIPLE